MRVLLDVLHESLNRVRTKPPYEEDCEGGETPRSKGERLWQGHLARDCSPVTDLFLGQLQSTILCHRCGSHFHTFEPFLDISLSLARDGEDGRFGGLRGAGKGQKGCECG